MILIQPQRISDVLLVTPRIFHDDRGYFFEAHHEKRYESYGIGPFVQDNVSRSRKGTIRGLHLHSPPHGQGKLISVLVGEIYDVAVDVRRGSPTFGSWVGVILSEKNHCQLYVPDGFAHGFCVVSDEAIVTYKCTSQYNPGSELSIAWNDPWLNVDWPVTNPVLSERDEQNPRLHLVYDRLPIT